MPPSVLAGGRSTDGPVWIEYIADDLKARFMDYAVGVLFFLLIHLNVTIRNASLDFQCCGQYLALAGQPLPSRFLAAE